MSTNNVRNAAQLHVRLAKYLPLDIAQNLNRKIVDDLMHTAWDNGWRDPEWLATYALEGTRNGNVNDAAALFVSQLRDACETPCNDDTTPTPPQVGTLRLAGTPQHHTPTSNPTKWADLCRQALRPAP